MTNKEVHLRNRKSRTARGMMTPPVSRREISLCCQGGVPCPVQGVPLGAVHGYPSPLPFPLPRKDLGSETGVPPPSLPERTHRQRLGYPLETTWDQTELPPRKDLGPETVVPLCEQTHACINITSRRTPYAGGNNFPLGKIVHCGK